MTDEIRPRASFSQSPPPPNDGNQLLDSETRAATPDGSVIESESVKKVESSGSQTPEREPRTRKQIVAGNIQYAALCFSMFMLGWNDGSTGPLLPRIQEVYGVRSLLSIHLRRII
jgi:hypothetical protein